jgi:hypothetical protein
VSASCLLPAIVLLLPPGREFVFPCHHSFRSLPPSALPRTCVLTAAGGGAALAGPRFCGGVAANSRHFLPSFSTP